MDRLNVDFEPFVDDGVRRYLNDGINHHNIAATGAAAYFPANFVVRGAGGEVVAGLLGEIWGGWLQVDVLWVAEALRGQGQAGRLMAAAEAYAIEKGCVGAVLDTFSFQARPFYERLGYRVFGQLADYPPGHTRFYMEKRLAG
jgi:GNAT superfamily N-acetyltransferase